MQITVTIPDSQWQEFQQLAQEAVETRHHGNYEEFATYIMSVNIDSYIESQKRKQAKKMKQALVDYEKSLEQEQEQEQGVPAIKAAVAKVAIAKPEPTPSSPKPAKKPVQDKTGDKAMTNKGLSERIKQLEEIPFKNRTMVEAQELNNLQILHKKRMRVKKK